MFVQSLDTVVGEILKPIMIIMMPRSINAVSINTHFNKIIVCDTTLCLLTN